MTINRQYSFWGSLSPLGGLAGAGLLIMASARLSWAITVAGSLLWVFGLSTFSFAFLLSAMGKKFFPAEGRKALFTCLSAFFGSTFLLMFWFMCPFAAFESFMLLLLVPLYCTSTGIMEQIQLQYERNQGDIFEHVSDAVSQAASLAVLLVVFAVVREPLSYSSLSLPGSSSGMVTIMHFASNSFFPIRIFASSAGALFVLGYIICLYQFGKDRINPGDNK
ncbi:MAG: hypothetical protein LBC80_00630 [Treponema sp.]|jgi:hypothetical protein|nr:hypothetical protein [Treponema sp.]